MCVSSTPQGWGIRQNTHKYLDQFILVVQVILFSHKHKDPH